MWPAALVLTEALPSSTLGPSRPHRRPHGRPAWSPQRRTCLVRHKDLPVLQRQLIRLSRSARFTRIASCLRKNMLRSSLRSQNALRIERRSAPRRSLSAMIRPLPGVRTLSDEGARSSTLGPDPVHQLYIYSTLDNAYTQLISSLDSTAQDHSALSDQLTSQVVDTTKALEKKYEAMKTKACFLL